MHIYNRVAWFGCHVSTEVPCITHCIFVLVLQPLYSGIGTTYYQTYNHVFMYPFSPNRNILGAPEETEIGPGTSCEPAYLGLCYLLLPFGDQDYSFMQTRNVHENGFREK